MIIILRNFLKIKILDLKILNMAENQLNRSIRYDLCLVKVNKNIIILMDNFLGFLKNHVT